MGKRKTPPKEKEAEGRPRKKAVRVDDAALITVPVASAPPKGEEAEGSPRKKAPRLDNAARATAPVASEPNPTRESPPKEEAEGSPPKRSLSPRNKSPRRQDKRPAAAVPLPTVPESSKLIVEAAEGDSDENRCKCNHAITDSAIEDLIPLLKSKDAWTCYGCRREDEKGIVKVRPEKSDLLICVTCYDHLCCGVGSIAYPFGHSRAHALKKKHWFAVLYCDPERGYCFKCNAEVPMPVKFGEGGNEVGIQVIRNIVSQKLLAPPPSVGQTEPEVNPEKVEMTGKVQAESRPSGFGVDLANKWPSYESRSSDAQGYAIRGIPNFGNTCYMSAVLQCLFVLGELREKMLALDRPKGLLPELLKELFVEASAAGDVLDPTKVLRYVGLCKAPRFKVGAMEDSHELLAALRNIWNEDTILQKMWSFISDIPSKWHPTKSGPQTSESPGSRKREIAVQLFPADVQRNLEKMKTVSESGYSRIIGSEVIVEETHKPLEVDSTQAQCISQSKDVLQIQEGKSVDSLTEDSISIEDFLLLFSEGQVEWCCPNCAKDHEEPSASQSKNGEQMVGSGNEDTTVVGDQTEQSDRTAACHNEEPECHGGILPAEKQTALLGTKLSADVKKQLMMYPERENQSEQKDDVGDAIQKNLFTILPAVLTLQINRIITFKNNLVGRISGHVRFMEYLDVGRFMDPSSVGRGSTLYRLAGVVEHIGTESLKAGHYVAYVRARRLGNQQQQSSCSSWFCADDNFIRQVTLEQVLKCKACIIFYERMEDHPPRSDWHTNSGSSNVKQIRGQDSAISDPEVSLPMPFLPPSVVWNIWRQHCNDSDRIRMRFVSRLWYEHLPRKMALRPWVVGSEMANGIFHYVHGKNLGLLKFKCKIPSGTFFSSCWDFLMMETGSGFSIWNPSDSMILKLPVTTCEKIVMQEASDSYAFTYSSMGKFRFCYGRPMDDRSWKNIVCYDRSFMDICKHENEFYAVTSFFKIHKLDRVSSKMELIGPQQNSDELRKLMGGYPDHIFIADLNRELIVIALGRNLQSVHLFKVVWTPEQIVSLVMVQELGCWSLFLGRNDAIALNAKDFPGIHANTLYLAVESMVDLEEPTTIQVYDLATRSLVDTGYASFRMGVPIFYHPSSVSAVSEF